MSKISKRSTILMPTAEEDKAITAAAKSDPDAQPLTPKQLKAMVPIRTLRGRPRSENKKLLVSVRYSPEVIAYFKSTGEGWQSRMDGVLREYVTRHSRSAPENIAASPLDVPTIKAQISTNEIVDCIREGRDR